MTDRKNRATRSPKHAPPPRGADAWARDAFQALKLEGNRSLRKGLTDLAELNDRLRDRPPASFAKMLQGSAKAVSLPVGDWLRLRLRWPETLPFREKTVRRRLTEVSKAFAVDAAAAMHIVQKEPLLLGYRNGSLVARSESIRRAAGFSPAEWPAFIIACPRTITYSRTQIANNVAGLGRILQLSPARTRELLMREPRLIAKDPEDVASFLNILVKYWSIDTAAAAAFVVKEPKAAVSGRIATMDRNVTKLAHELGVDKNSVVGTVLKFPPLAYQKPERLLAAVESGTAALGVSRQTLVMAFLRSPTLWIRRHEGWPRLLRLVLRIAAALGASLTAEQILSKLPTALIYSRKRLLQRYVMARLGLWTWNWTALLTLSDARARAILEAYFREHAEAGRCRNALAWRGML
jgi:hypothetical protein